jgi:hypothetical protein
MKHIIFLFFAFSFLAIQSCRKTIVVIPKACMTLSASTIHSHDTLIVHNCSVADQTTVTYIDSTQLPPNECKCSSSYEIISKNGYNAHVFPKPGAYRVCLSAENHQTGAPIQYLIQSVRVLP